MYIAFRTNTCITGTRPSKHMTLKQRCINIDATSWRRIDIVTTLFQGCVLAGDIQATESWGLDTLVNGPVFLRFFYHIHLINAQCAKKLFFTTKILNKIYSTQNGKTLWVSGLQINKKCVTENWAVTCDFQQCGIFDKCRLRRALVTSF